MMTMIEDKVLEKHPDLKLRWIYQPPHDETYSQAWKREMDGYSFVDPEVEGLELPHGKVGNRIQIGDLVLMAIDSETRAEIDAELADTAKQEARRSREAYYESVKKLKDGEREVKPTGDIRDRTEVVQLKSEEQEEVE